jgi:hypothetical protein
MPKPATFTPAEISALASRMRELWRPGSQITPWLRDHADRLTRLNREERYSWAAVATALNEVGIVYRTGNPWTATNLAKAVSEVRPGGRGNPTAERRAELAAWKAELDDAKAQEDVAFAAEWEAMPRDEQDELLDLWRRTDHLSGTAAARFLSRSGYGKVLRGAPYRLQMNDRSPLFSGSFQRFF